VINFKKISESNLLCSLNLAELYQDKDQLKIFDSKWEEFYNSDETNRHVFNRKGNIITYPHKSWIPLKNNSRPSLLILAGNPAPHSVWKDIYYAYEGNGGEHRFWKVLRELGFIDLYGKDVDIKNKFLNLKYSSPFRLGIEVIFTFPSTASKPKWSGVMGLERLFGKKYLSQIYEVEKLRLQLVINSFFKDKNGLIIAMQKDAYNAVSTNKYNLKLAVTGGLSSEINGIQVVGTPPTRWLYTKKMQSLLSEIKTSRSAV